MTIIDSHCHVYPQAIALKAVKGVSNFYDGVHSFGDGLASTVQKLWPIRGVGHAIIFSVATKLEQVDHINAFIASTVASSVGFFTGLGTIHPDTPDMPVVVERILALGLRGIKLHPDTQRCAIDDPRLLPLYDACAGRLPILLHTGDSRYDYSNPDRMLAVLKMFPRTTFIGAHFGGWSVWDQATEMLHSFDNFYVDSSSTFHWVDSSKVKTYIRTYGSQKVMLGSDFPMWDVKPELDQMFSLHLSSAEYDNIFNLTATRLFGL